MPATAGPGTDVKTALVIPCYNEERRLPVETLASFAQAPCADLLFVDDGSTDGTLDRIAEVVRQAPAHTSVLHLERNCGKAEAIRSGMNLLLGRGYEYVGFWDADLATPLRLVPDFIQVLDERPDIEWVFGARVKLLGRHIERRPVRHYLGRVFATMASLALALPIYDTQCGAKLFRASPALSRVLAHHFLSRWIFDVEMVARFAAVTEGAKAGPATAIYELPLSEWRDVRGSKLKPPDFLRAIGELARIRRDRQAYARRSQPALGAPAEGPGPGRRSL